MLYLIYVVVAGDMLSAMQRGDVMRHVLSFLIASALFVGGLYVLYMHVVGLHRLTAGVVWAVAFLVAIGAARLWINFIEPMIRGKETD